jgi:septal ring factor EnvC (AmiA/AmiB activator)
MRFWRLLPLLAVLVAVAVAATPASGDVASRKAAVDARLQAVQAKIDWAQRREGELAGEIASVNGQIRGLQTQVGDVSERLAALERDLELHREKLDRLNELFRVQTQRYHSTGTSTRRFSTASATASSTSTKPASRTRSRCCSCRRRSPT